jgi:hypothetical protein
MRLKRSDTINKLVAPKGLSGICQVSQGGSSVIALLKVGGKHEITWALAWQPTHHNHYCFSFLRCFEAKGDVHQRVIIFIITELVKQWPNGAQDLLISRTNPAVGLCSHMEEPVEQGKRDWLRLGVLSRKGAFRNAHTCPFEILPTLLQRIPHFCPRFYSRNTPMLEIGLLAVDAWLIPREFKHPACRAYERQLSSQFPFRNLNHCHACEARRASICVVLQLRRSPFSPFDMATLTIHVLKGHIHDYRLKLSAQSCGCKRQFLHKSRPCASSSTNYST